MSLHWVAWYLDIPVLLVTLGATADPQGPVQPGRILDAAAVLSWPTVTPLSRRTLHRTSPRPAVGCARG